MKNPKRFVITGGAGFGKSSIIEQLEALGFTCFHEISRSIIQEQLLTNGDILPWKNLELFSKVVIEKRLEQYQQANNFNLSFFDRGIPDAISYLIKENIAMPPAYYTYLKEYTYQSAVFITPPWLEIFKNDSERKENFEQAGKDHYFIETIYRNLGYDIIEIPKTNLNNRVQFVLHKIQQYI